MSNDSSALFSSQPSIAANGTLTFTPAANAYGSATVSVILNDGQAANNLSTTETFTITINAVNDAPSFTKGADQVVNEDTSAITITNWATSISAGPGETEAVTFDVSNDSSAIFSIQPAIAANGTLTYTPAANAYGSATVSVTLNDGQASNNLSATKTFTITINAVNDVPSFTKGADQVVNEDTTAITISNWATSISAGPGESEAVTFDVSNDSSALFSSQPSIAANGTLTFTPAANAYGSATVSVILNDGQAANNLSTTETFTITINAVNDAPSFTKGADQVIDEDAGAQTILNWATAISAGEGESQSLTFEVSNDSAALFSGQPAIDANGTLTYTPAANAYGSATVSVTLNDGQASNNLSATETFTITINGVNDAPSYTKGADQVVNEDTTAITVSNWATSISAGPGETEAVTFDVSNDSSALFSVQPSIAANGTLTYTPAANAYGSATVSVTLNDGQAANNLSATETFTIAINAVNDAPSFTKGADQSIDEDAGAQSIANWATAISAGPGETETVTFDVTNDSSALFSVQPSIAANGTLTYTPAANAYGSATVSVTLNDGQSSNNLSSTETFTITINSVNDAPSFSKGADQVVNEDTSAITVGNWATSISAGPGETEVVTFDVSNDSSALFSVQPSIASNGTLTYTPAANAYGSATVSVTLNDGQTSNNLSATEIFTITINAINDAPSFTKGADQVVNEDTTAITVSNWATSISAGPGETETVTFDVTNDSSALFSVQPSIATNGTLTYTPAANAYGSATVSVTLNDGQAANNLSTTETFTITINAVNDAPSFTKGADQVIDEDAGEQSIANWASAISAGPGETESVTFDVNNDSSALFSVQPSISANGTLTFTPAANAYGSATVSVTLNDGQASNNLSSTETFTITINAVNDAPSFTKGADEVVNEDTTAITITNWATAISAGPGETETVTFDVTNDSSALFSAQPEIAANGTLTFTPAANAYGSATVSVTLNDGQASNNLSSTETFTITINAVNDAPSFTKGADQVIDEDPGAQTILNWATAISAGPGETESVTFDVNNDSSALFSVQPSISANGTLTFTPAANAYGSATVSVTLNDGQATNNLSTTETFTITINAVNDAPSFTKGADQVIDEDAGAQSITNWATAISAGSGETESVSFNVTNDSSALFSVQPSIAANGTLTYTPAVNAYGLATVSVSLNDGQATNNLSSTETFTITINAVNDAPSFTKGADQVIDEDAGAQTILNWATAISAGPSETESVSFDVTNDSSALFSVQPSIAANGTLTFTPEANTYGSATVSVTLNDGQASNNLSSTETFTITINAVNDAPSFTKGADQVIDEDAGAQTILNWATAISAGPGETESVTFDVNNDSSALFSVQPSIASNGTLTFTPAANAYGSATVSVTLNDGQASNNLSSTETFTITINAVNDAPSFTKGADQVIDEDAGAQTILNWATAISAGSGETESVSFNVTNDSSALFSVQPAIASNGTLTYTPAANAYGSATVSVTLNDGQAANNLSTTETFTITINAINDAPSFTKGADQVVNEDTTAITVSNWPTVISAGPGETEVVIFDVTNDSSALFSVQPSIAANGTLTYTPAANAYGSATVSVTLNDGQATNNLSSTETFTITINGVNDAPSFTKGGDQSIDEDAGAQIILNWATAISAGPSETESVSFDVTNDSSALFSVQPSISANGTLTYTPAANAYGSATVSVTLNDGQATNNLSSTETFTITINGVNDAPSFTKGADQVVNEDTTAITITNWAKSISAGPGETEVVTFDVTNDSSALFSVQPSIDANGTLTYTPAANAYGSATVSVTLNDGQATNNLSTTETFTITINAINDAPSFSKGADQVIDEDAGAQTILNWATAISAGEGELQSLTFEVSNDSATLFSGQPAIDANGALMFTPAANAYGSATVSVTLNDGQASNNLSATETFTITINAVNDVPSFTKGTDQVIDEDAGAQTILNWATAISAGEGESQSLTFEVSNDSAALFSGQPAIDANGALMFTPAANAYGSATVSVILNDGQAANNLSTTETFTITINAVNDAPSFTKGADQVVNEDTTAISVSNWATAISAGPGETESVSFDVTNDSSALFSVQPSINSNGTLTYTPSANAYGSATVSVTLNDGQAANNLSTTETFTITINAVNDVPSFTKGADQEIDEDAGAQSIANWATSISAGPGETEAVTFDVSNDSSALFSIQPAIAANGTLTYTPAANAYGSATVSVTLNDGQATNNLSSTETFTITINGVNDAPSFSKGTDQVIDEDAGAQTVSNWATAISAGPGETEAVTFDVSNDSSALFSVQPAIASNGTLTYTPAANAYGSATVSVTLNDGQATNNLSSTETFTITINAINDAPSFTKGADQVIDEDAGAQTILNWATAISAGEGESQSLTFEVSNDSAALFSGQPAIDANGALMFTPAANAYGSATVSVTLNDGQAANNLSTTETFTITINAVNDAPVITSINAVETLEDISFFFKIDDLKIEDADSELSEMSVRVLSGANYTAQGATLTPDSNFFGELEIELVVNDGTSDSEPFKASLQVIAVNDAPTFTAGADINIEENTGNQSVRAWATSVSWGAVNEAGQVLTFELSVDKPELFDELPAINSAGDLSFKTKSQAFGVAAVDVQLFDDGGTTNGGKDASTISTFKISISEVNDAPVITDQKAKSAQAGETVTISLEELIVEDPDNAYPTDFSLAIYPGEHYIVTEQSIRIAAEYAGNLPVEVSVNDGELESNIYEFLIAVSAQDDPIITGQRAIAFDEDTSYEITLDDLTIENARAEMQLSFASGELYTLDENILTPKANYNGPLNVAITLIWSGGETTPFELQMEVLPVNDQPVANDDVFEVFFGEELQANVLANDTDIDGDELTVEAETISNGRTILALNADGSIVFSSSDQAGAFNHYYKTCDAGGLCTEGLLTVNVIYGDFDDDQIPDEVEIGTFDTDEDGIPDFQDTDADNDGIPDAIEAGVDPVNPVDTDADGTPDYLDLDSDADGKSDLEEGIEDCDADGIPNYLDANEACEQIVAAEGFSPNGDGINDLWELAGIEDYPNNKVQIYNRWGTLVKEFTNYNNTSNAWAGLNRFSKEVPDGTYFYIVTIQGENNPAGIQLNGYIIVSR
ncbi:tandem-95 repeat protein [Marinoscillum furvescens]|uniref:tandem-95 repeat protein n=1 Tax=Marinoscillum furvescens TaxID=1026 RepID=UPI001C884331|nr:Ig-like domain-containing protein [Marinoscillum furvescens]